MMVRLGKLPALQEQAAALAAEIEKVKAQGDVVHGIRIERYTPGGTASNGSKARQYARLRAVDRGAKFENGRTTRTISGDEIAHYEAAISRGKQVVKLEKKLARVREQLAKLEKIAWELLGDSIGS